MEIYTIGFTKKSAREFFGLLDDARIRRLVDVRLRNASQLAGFSKRDDLEFFLDQLLGVDYEHRTELAPSPPLMDAFRKEGLAWERFRTRFLDLLAEREIAATLDREPFEVPTVLLCSEHTPERCHRRLVAEHLADGWGGASIRHL